MPTNRELYFNLIKKNNKYLTRMVVKSLLNYVNGFNDEVSLYKYFDLDCPKHDELMNMVSRIENEEPYQYVLGEANFIDRMFYVNPSVLIPRQETEQLVINVKTMIESRFGKDAKINIADIGTGSGVIAITLKRYFPSSIVYGVDISPEALEISSKNAAKLGQNVEFLEGNMLEPLIEKGIKFDVIVSNPPYIEDESTIEESTYKHEPHLALLAKPSTKFYEEMIKNADKVLNENGLMAFEIGEDMEEPLIDVVYKYLPTANILFSKDIYNKTRFLYIIDMGELKE